MKNKTFINFLFLQLTLLVYAISNIPSKLASNEEFLSFKFCLYYGLIILTLGIYALLWQQVLKKFSLNIAYANKAISIVWSMLIGFVVFKEDISLFNILGTIIVVIGIIVMVKGEQENE